MDAPFYRPYPVRRCNRRNLIGATFDLLRAWAWRHLRRAFGDRRLGWLLSTEMRDVAAADLVVDLSGDMLTDDYGPHVAYSHYIPLFRAMVLRRPYFLCAQSIGPFTWTRPLARRVLEGAAAVSVRDGVSLDYLRDIGIGNPAMEPTADLAFLLSPCAEKRVDEIFAAEGIVLDDRPVLGISVSQLIERHYRAGGFGARRPSFEPVICTAIEAVARRHDLQVLFVSHVTGPSAAKNDHVIAERITDALAGDIPAAMLRGDYRPE